MKVRVKMPANIMYEVSSTGNIKAKNIMEVLFQNEHVSKKKDSVIESIENCLYDNKEIKAAYYDMLVNELELHLSDYEYKECPSCHRGIEGYPAISRKDNKTEICSQCGQDEAMEAFNNYYGLK